FQAEAGIRDFHVTGVQTCALPILARSQPGGFGSCGIRQGIRWLCRQGRTGLTWTSLKDIFDDYAESRSRPAVPSAPGPDRDRREIGRASCRERVEFSVDAELLI